MFDLLQEPTMKITDNILKDNTKKPNVNQLPWLFFSYKKAVNG